MGSTGLALEDFTPRRFVWVIMCVDWGLFTSSRCMSFRLSVVCYTYVGFSEWVFVFGVAGDVRFPGVCIQKRRVISPVSIKSDRAKCEGKYPMFSTSFLLPFGVFLARARA